MNRAFFFSIALTICSLSVAAQPMEEVFVHTDKECYLAGEIIWFKLYVVDPATLKPLSLSKSAFIEIISNDQKPIRQARIALDSGLGTGSFQLPLSLHSGHFLLRAYTNWMKNAAPETWFQEQLTILNPLREDLTAVSPAKTGFDVAFFPEGGNFVRNIPNHFAFRIVDSGGKSHPCTGILLDSRGDTLSRFQTKRFGMGDFFLTPRENEHYKVALQIQDGPTLTYELPTPENTGYTMQLSNQDKELRLAVHANNTGKDSILWLIVHTPNYSRTIRTIPVSDTATFMLEKDSLPAGVSCITIFNAQKTPVGERLWFNPPRPASFLHIQPDRDSYGPREKITLDLTALGTENQPLRLHGSMAVALRDDIQNPSGGNILTYLQLTSSLKGHVESPDYYFSPANTDRQEIANLLLMTQGWRRISPPNTLHDRTYIPEYGGIIATGHITDRRTGKPLPGITAWLSAPGQPFHLSRSVSNDDGDIQWDLGDLYGAQELVVQTGNAHTDSICRIEITSPFAESSDLPYLPPATQPLPPDALIRNSISVQAQNAYQPTLRQHFIQTLPPDTTAFFGQPDKTYALDDYTRYTTMEEVMREYVKEVRLRNKKGDFEFRVQSDQANQLFFDSAPLVLLDGVPTANCNNIIRFDPLKIRKIDIVAKRYVYGETIYDGIVSYQTYNNDISGFPLDGNAYILDYDGLQLHREFFSPVYETHDQQQSRIPDLRTVLYWSGDILTDPSGHQQLSFYTSDLPGTYSIIIQGITPDGQPGAATIPLNIKPLPPR